MKKQSKHNFIIYGVRQDIDKSYSKADYNNSQQK